MKHFALGFDTSNYTTSVAYYDGESMIPNGKLLPVKQGELGLRQSDALFHHIRQLPEVFLQISQQCDLKKTTVIGVSTRPRAVEGSYMPCFLAGKTVASILSQTLSVPLVEVSHQQGHIAAAALSTNHLELLDEEILVWHLSGGTTELLHAYPDGHNIAADIIGGTSDISAGQLIDRVGVELGIRFPAGKEIDRLAGEALDFSQTFPVKVKDCTFSLSGMQNKISEFAKSNSPSNTAKFTLNIVSTAIEKTTAMALDQYPNAKVLFSGGVSSNSLLRRNFKKYNNYYFAEPQYSTDNAMGVAYLAWRMITNGAL